jgi:hypothetical protein
MKQTKLLLMAILIIAFTTSCSESWKRSLKTISSDFTGGLPRTISVYTYDGKLLRQYSGQIDIQINESGNKVLFDKEGRRTIIYNCLVIAEEK